MGLGSRDSLASSPLVKPRSIHKELRKGKLFFYIEIDLGDSSFFSELGIGYCGSSMPSR